MIKNLAVITCLLSTSILIAGCSASKDSEGITKEGLCTEATVNVYNDIMTKQAWQYSVRSQSEITTLESQCSNYYRLIADSSCKAQKLMTGQEFYISASSVAPVCKEMLTSLKNQAQTTASYLTCNPSVETSFSIIQKYLGYYQESGSMADAMAASRECANFRRLNAPGSCYTHDGKHVGDASVTFDCRNNDDAISKYYNSKPMNPGTIAPIGGEKQIDDLSSVIRLTANDAVRLSVSISGEFPIQKGEVAYNKRAELPSCLIQGNYDFANGKSVALPKIEKQVSKIILKSADEKLVITCDKEANSTTIGWTVSDLQKIFADTATISSIE
jgi:hypothetical protein